jgi:hypothetical protein
MAAFVEEQDNVSFDWDITKRLAGYLTPHRRSIIIAVVA